MDVEKVKKWIDFTHSFQKSGLWPNANDKYPPEKFFKKEEKKESVVLKRDVDYPRIDVYQDDTHIYILIEAPGIDPKAIHLSLQSKHQLIMKGTFQKPSLSSETAIITERYYGDFERTIQLPEPTESHLIQLSSYHGLIQIIYPRFNEITPLQFSW
ncbi:Hsp20/alpha crystallin family protein [Oceanobacillus piezotolerans]|uniref:Hsp20/alpha crystallin family protein n=1 Tax=Oceanobacillus piezotolerans TaxID=2448030 RepID=A0A498DMV0_9BACI|nr:Hsp20/alpha crystallin family protein [Oceanobacillus piezotolerans]RLL48380.1 Hsp20/alpha crystallin family protein [Oceanobacillus piezotolerans]